MLAANRLRESVDLANRVLGGAIRFGEWRPVKFDSGATTIRQRHKATPRAPHPTHSPCDVYVRNPRVDRKNPEGLERRDAAETTADPRRFNCGSAFRWKHVVVAPCTNEGAAVYCGRQYSPGRSVCQQKFAARYSNSRLRKHVHPPHGMSFGAQPWWLPPPPPFCGQDSRSLPCAQLSQMVVPNNLAPQNSGVVRRAAKYWRSYANDGHRMPHTGIHRVETSLIHCERAPGVGESPNRW
jgi:hypothetical protein